MTTACSDGDAGWRLLNECDRSAAREVFELLRAHDRVRALSGLIAVAKAECDRPALARALKEIRADDPPLLLLRAALAAQAQGVRAHELMRWAAAVEGSVAPRLTAQVRARAAWSATTAGRRNRVRWWGRTMETVRLAYIGSVPIVMVSVDDAATAAFIVDTGASMSVITPEYARSIGVCGLAGTHYELSSPGGWLTTELARVRLGLGGVTVEDAEVALLDLPIPGLAGVLSPHSTLGGCHIALSFRDQALRLARHAPGARPEVELPLVLGDGRPQLRVERRGYPPRFFTLDTGSEHSWMCAPCADSDDGKRPTTRAVLTHAGGGTSVVRTSEEPDEIVVAGIPWRWQRPSVGEAVAGVELRDLESAGVIGMDFMMGRELDLEPAGSLLWLSEQARLPAWHEGASATFRIEGEWIGDTRRLVETVVARSGNDVRLRLALSGLEPVAVEQEVEDSWTTRAGFLATRPSRANAQLEPFWQRVFMPFRPRPQAPRVRVFDCTLLGRAGCCTELAIQVDTPRGPATLRLASLPHDGWRICRAELAAPDGRMLWRYVREKFEARA